MALFEAGPKDYNETVMSPLGAPALHGTSLEYNCLSERQPSLCDRHVPNYVGRLLSASSAVNYGNWTRCHSADYDGWASLVGDTRWNYEGLLKCFKKSEHHHDPMRIPKALVSMVPFILVWLKLATTLRQSLSETRWTKPESLSTLMRMPVTLWAMHY